MNRSTVVKAVAGTVVVVAAVTGAALWIGNDGKSGGTVEEGKRGAAREGSFEVIAAEKEVAKLRAEREALAAEKEALVKDKGELEQRAAAAERELKALKDEAAEKEKKSAAERKLALSFGDWGEMEEISGFNWREMGEAAAKIGEVLKEMAESDQEFPMEKRLQIAGENQKLATPAIKVMGKLPTHATGNGEFTHPIIHWNLLAERLELAGLPLSEAQVRRMNRLGVEYDLEWDRLQKGYAQDALELEKVLDELEVKKTFMDRLEALLSREQREAVTDPETRHVYMIDLNSPLLLLAGRSRTVAKESKEELRKAIAPVWAEVWGLEASLLEQHGAALDSWLAAVDARLAPVPARLTEWFRYDDAMAAGRAQAKLMHDLLSSPDLPEASKGKISASSLIVVPRLVAKR